MIIASNKGDNLVFPKIFFFSVCMLLRRHRHRRIFLFKYKNVYLQATERQTTFILLDFSFDKNVKKILRKVK